MPNFVTFNIDTANFSKWLRCDNDSLKCAYAVRRWLGGSMVDPVSYHCVVFNIGTVEYQSTSFATNASVPAFDVISQHSTVAISIDAPPFIPRDKSSEDRETQRDLDWQSINALVDQSVMWSRRTQ